MANEEPEASVRIKKPVLFGLAIGLLLLGGGVGFGGASLLLSPEKAQEEVEPPRISIETGNLLLRRKVNGKTVTNSVTVEAFLSPEHYKKTPNEVRNALIASFNTLSEIPLISTKKLDEKELYDAILIIVQQHAPWIEKVEIKKIRRTGEPAENTIPKMVKPTKAH